MFKHPKSKYTSENKDDFSFIEKVDQFFRSFNIPEIKAKEDVLNSLLDKIGETQHVKVIKTQIRSLYLTIGSVAAAACLVLFFYPYFTMETFTANDQASNVCFLPDHSRVVLEEGSEISFAKNFKQRNVKLKGEAYFEVKSGSDFYVKSRHGGVLVIGTRFRVDDRNNDFNVHCYQGTVGVDYGDKKVKLTKGMDFKGQNKTFEVKDNFDVGYPDFANFNFTCQNKPINEIWKDIETYFGVEILADINENKVFTGAILTGDIHEVMDIVCTSMELTATFQDDHNIVVELKN